MNEITHRNCKSHERSQNKRYLQNNNTRFKQNQTRFCTQWHIALCTTTLKTKFGTLLNIEKGSKIIINAVGAIRQVNKITDQTSMTTKNLGRDT